MGAVHFEDASRLDEGGGVEFIADLAPESAIGIEKFSGQSTCAMNILATRFGNLIATTPGTMK